MTDNPNLVEPQLFQREAIMIANDVLMSRTPFLFLLEFKGQGQIYFKYVKQLKHKISFFHF